MHCVPLQKSDPSWIALNILKTILRLFTYLLWTFAFDQSVAITFTPRNFPFCMLFGVGCACFVIPFISRFYCMLQYTSHLFNERSFHMFFLNLYPYLAEMMQFDYIIYLKWVETTNIHQLFFCYTNCRTPPRQGPSESLAPVPRGLNEDVWDYSPQWTEYRRMLDVYINNMEYIFI